MIGGCSVLLDGVNDYVTLGTVAARDFTSSPFSLLAWVYLRALPGATCFVIGHGATSTNGYSLEINSVGNVRLRTNQAGAQTSVITTTAPVAAGLWIHLAATKGGTSGKVYVNGELVQSGTLANPVASAGPTVVGANSSGGAMFLSGAIDEPAFFNRELTQQQIRQYMLAQLSAATPGCVSLHHFDDGLSNFSSTVAAATVGGVAGTLTGGASWVYDRWAPWIEPRVTATGNLAVTSATAAVVPGTLRNFIPRVKSRILVVSQWDFSLTTAGTGHLIGEVRSNGVALAAQANIAAPAGALLERGQHTHVATADLDAGGIYALDMTGRVEAGATIRGTFNGPHTGFAMNAEPADSTF